MMTSDQNCRGPVPFGSTGRRAFLQTGLAGFAALSLPGILKLQSRAAAPANVDLHQRAGHGVEAGREDERVGLVFLA